MTAAQGHALRNRGFHIVVALTSTNGIGFEQKLPWTKKLSIDMTFFRFLTTVPWEFVTETRAPSASKSVSGLDLAIGARRSNEKETAHAPSVVLMGRKTWESVQLLGLPPFVNRINGVLTRGFQSTLPQSILQFGSLEAAASTLLSSDSMGHVFVIGGGQIYSEALSSLHTEHLFVTRVLSTPTELPIDTWFPHIPTSLYECMGNMTPQVMSVLMDWNGTGKNTKALLNEHVLRSADTIEEHGYHYQFIWYKRIH